MFRLMEEVCGALEPMSGCRPCTALTLGSLGEFEERASGNGAAERVPRQTRRLNATFTAAASSSMVAAPLPSRPMSEQFSKGNVATVICMLRADCRMVTVATLRDST